MTSQKFAVDQLVLESASVLTPAHFESFSRLCKKVVYGPDFQLLLVDCRDQLLQQQLQKLLSAVCQKAGFAENQLSLSADIPDVFELQQRLQQLAVSHQLIQLTQAAAWFNVVPDGKRWQEFNLLRENIAQSVNCKLVLWLDETAINQMINQAPDWWAWRSGVYTFSAEHEVGLSPPQPNFDHVSRLNLSKAKAAARIAELRSWLAQYENTEPEIAAPLALEMGCLYHQMGYLDDALSVYESQCLPLFTKLDDVHSIAVTYSCIADIKESRGDLNEALDIRLKLELPVHQKLGDKRGVAMTQLKIADAYIALGKIDTALDILSNDSIPGFQQFGDARDVALAYGRVADILHMQKNYEAELSIRIEKELPAFKELGDSREFVIVQSKVADILAARGELSEALHIYLDTCVPAFEKLGDSIYLALSKAKIAKLWMVRGKPEDRLNAKAYLQEALDVTTQANLSEAKFVKQLQDKYF
ncbi:tetratricopeptide repeat protein [Rheinheimera soli]|uniref:Tetratricopeptide (TPR) repeat protein n=1 Tax=Rheinheimera soli TaxID=443616 RepID=A0ABU1VYF2_9GAMM|nr:tetratricopeptide repeat protein [Rheinheimera soli]MDR7120630.1 tetratricopeptide (TPR) repeat protein [Rheinheimera soli]